MDNHDSDELEGIMEEALHFVRPDKLEIYLLMVNFRDQIQEIGNPERRTDAIHHLQQLLKELKTSS